MCGIAGLAGKTSDRRAVLERISAGLVHRGPDESGTYDEAWVTLAIRRLSIIDVADGHQPYQNEQGSIHVVFNGEIYGFKRLRERLERAGTDSLPSTDGEVIAHAYEEYGDGFVSELDGMFAFALWDQRAGRLILARDRLGKKPLFVAHHGDGTLSFASELGALLLDERIARDVDETALAEYLQYGYIPSPRTILRGVTKLEPGTMLTWEPSGRVQRRRYWQLDFGPKQRLSYADALEEFQQRSLVAVRERLVSDVPLGVFLSGGVDSSFILAQMVAAGAPDVQSFAIGFSDSRYDERAHSRVIAERLGSTHHEAVVEPTDLVEMLPKLVHHYGEPFADPSMVPTFYLARWARQRITVALTGEGGDELFGGYYRHQAARLAGYADVLPAGARRLAAQGAARVASASAHPMSLRHKLYRVRCARSSLSPASATRSGPRCSARTNARRCRQSCRGSGQPTHLGGRGQRWTARSRSTSPNRCPTSSCSRWTSRRWPTRSRRGRRCSTSGSSNGWLGCRLPTNSAASAASD